MPIRQAGFAESAFCHLANRVCNTLGRAVRCRATPSPALCVSCVASRPAAAAMLHEMTPECALASPQAGSCGPSELGAGLLLLYTYMYVYIYIYILIIILILILIIMINNNKHEHSNNNNNNNPRRRSRPRPRPLLPLAPPTPGPVCF